MSAPIETIVRTVTPTAEREAPLASATIPTPAPMRSVTKAALRGRSSSPEAAAT